LRIKIASPAADVSTIVPKTKNHDFLFFYTFSVPFLLHPNIVFHNS